MASRALYITSVLGGNDHGEVSLDAAQRMRCEAAIIEDAHCSWLLAVGSCAELADEDRAAFFYALLGLANAVAVADRMPLGDAESTPRAIERAALFLLKHGAHIYDDVDPRLLKKFCGDDAGDGRVDQRRRHLDQRAHVPVG